MFLPNPGIMAAGAVGSSKTYEQFVAHITPMSGTEQTWPDGFMSFNSFRVTTNGELIEPTSMTGSTWLSVFRAASQVARAIQHAMPDEATFNIVRFSGTMILVRTEAAGTSAQVALNRNGYLSLSGAATTVRRCTEILAWIDDQPMRIQPHLGIGPEPYDWT